MDSPQISKLERRIRVDKSWGDERWIVNNDQYCGKILTVRPGQHCGWHWHPRKTETFWVLAGVLELYSRDWPFETGNRAVTYLLADECALTLPAGTAHTFRGRSGTAVTFLEISTHHDDADTIRLPDWEVPWGPQPKAQAELLAKQELEQKRKRAQS